MPALDPEVARQPAASGVECAVVDTGFAQQAFVGGVPEHRVLVTVLLGQRADVERVELHIGRVAFEELGECRCGHGRCVEELVHVVAQHGQAARFETDDRRARLDVVAQHVQAVTQDAPGDAELACGDPRQATTDRGAGEDDVEPGVFQHPRGRRADLRCEVVGERVRPQHHPRAVSTTTGFAPPRPAQRGGGERREFALVRDAAEALRQRGDGAGPQCRVGEAGKPGGQPGPQRQETQGVVARGAHLARVMVVQELRLVGGHVDVDGAVGETPLARQAQVEGVADLGGVPTVGDRLAAQHLEQQPRATARGVLLALGHHVARAHHPGARVDALADADAAPGRGGEAAAVVRVAQGQRQLFRGPGEAQVGVEGAGADEVAGVQQVVRVPDRLERFEQAQHLGRVHARQQLRAGLPVAVFARQRPAVGHHEIGGVGEEAPERRDAVVGEQVEVDAHVHAALAEVPVRDAAQPVRREERAERAQVGTEPFRRDGGVLPARPGLRTVGHARGGAGGGFADAPELSLPRRVGGDGRRGAGLARQRRRQRFGVVAGLVGVVAADLDEQPAAAGGQRVERRGTSAAREEDVDEVGAHALHGERPVRQHLGRGVGGGDVVGEPGHHEGPRGR